MKWLWNNSIDLISGGAVFIGVALVCAFFAYEGFGLIFHIAYLGSVTLGAISFLCGSIIFCLRFGVRSDPNKVIIISLFAQLLLFIPSYLLQSQVNVYLRLYSPLVRLIVGGLWFVSAQMASILLLIGLIRRFYYNRPQP